MLNFNEEESPWLLLIMIKKGGRYMPQVIAVLGRILGSTVVRLAATGALLGFGWIFGEQVASKIIDRMEADPESVDTTDLATRQTESK